MSRFFFVMIIIFSLSNLVSFAQEPGGDQEGSDIPSGKTADFELIEIKPTHNLSPMGLSVRLFSGEVCFRKTPTGPNQIICGSLLEIQQSHNIKFYYPNLNSEVTSSVGLLDGTLGQTFSYTGMIAEGNTNPAFYIVVERNDENLIGNVALERSLEEQIANYTGTAPTTLTQQLNTVRNLLLSDYPVAVYEWVHPLSGARNPSLRYTTHNKNYRVEFKYDRADTFVGEKTKVRFKLKSLRPGAQTQDMYTSRLEGIEMHSNRVNSNVTDLVGSIPEILTSGLRKVDFRTSLINKQNHYSTIPIEFYHPTLTDITNPEIVGGSGVRVFKNAQDVLIKVSDSSGRIQMNYLEGTIPFVKYNSSGQQELVVVGGAIAEKIGKTTITDAGMNGAQTVQFKTDASSMQDGDYCLQTNVQDFSYHLLQDDICFQIDSTTPTIQFPLADSYITNQEQFELPLSIFDSANTDLSVWMNGFEVFSGQGNSFSVPLTLQEGINLITLIATDSVGNQTTIQRVVILDRTVPALDEIAPSNGQSIATQFFIARGKANENLSQAFINGVAATVENGREFNAPVTAYLEGEQTLEIRLIDLVGNESTQTTSYSIAKPLLHIDLVSISPTENGKLIIQGAVGSARENVSINVDGGFFNAEDIVPLPDGSFSVVLDYFSSVEITATDENFDFEEEYNLSYNVDTTLSGIVKDSSELPIPGVTVTILSSGQTTTTNASGIFTIANPALGDQRISIDGTTVPFEVTGGTKEYSKVSLNVAIGNRQQNVIERSIYITPKFLDGTETTVVNGGQVTVTSDHAPGVQLVIPGMTFPDGSDSGTINMSIIDAQKTSVELPDGIVPQTVVALEPSGLAIAGRAELTLPNDNDFPEGIELVILSKNSETGMWELDGSATVEGGVIKTKPGQGISHFSEVFAAPFGMEIKAYGPQDRPGINTDVGQLTTSVSLPSYQRLGTKIEPKLIYKSAWANPHVTVSNVFNLPKKNLSFSNSGSGNLLGLKVVNVTETVEAWLTPETVYSQLFVGGKQSPRLEFSAYEAPEQSVITYGVDLSDMPTGVYPSAADYEIKYRNLVIRTTKTKTTEFFKTRVSIKSYVEQDLFESVFEPELRSLVFLQNKKNSEFGSGWKLGMNQKIVNPSNDRVMIENEDGSISSYTLKNAIHTVAHDADGVESISIKGDDLFYSDEKGKLLNVSLAAENSNPVELFQTQSYQGNIGVNSVRVSTAAEYCCRSGFFGCEKKCPKYLNACDRSTYAYNHGKKIHSILNIADGQFLFLDQYGAIFQSNGADILRAGSLTTPTRIDITSENSTVSFQPECQSRIQNDCNTDSKVTQYTYEFWTEDNRGALSQCGGAATESTGLFPVVGNENLLSISKFNKPFSMLSVAQANIVYVADTGNNIVRKVDFNAGTITTIAGNQQTYDTGDDVQATLVSIYHPKGLAGDSIGNLYISSERGYIRKVDPSGIIDIIAGKPLNQGGELVESGWMENFNLKDPTSLVLDEENNQLYVADTGNHRIVQLDLTTRKAKVVAGNGQCIVGPVINGLSALDTSICSPTQIALDSNKNIFYVDKNNQLIRKISMNSDETGTQYYSSREMDNTKLLRFQDGHFERSYRDGSVASFSANGLHSQSTDLTGKITTFTYNEQGFLTSITDPTEGVAELDYSGDKLTEFTDPAGRITSFYYSGNQLTEVVFPDETRKTFQYDLEDMMTSEVNQRGFSISYEYNSLKKLFFVANPDGSSTSITDSQSKNYYETQYSGNGPALKNYDEESGYVVSDSITNSKGATTTFVKETNGFVSKIIDAQNKETLIDRDALGRPIKITRPDLSYTDLIYNQETGDLISQYESLTDSTETYVYNNNGQILTHTDPAGLQTTRTYDLQTGLLLTATDSRGVLTSRSYTNLGLIATLSNSLGQVQNYTYGSDGNVSQTTSPMGETTLFQRDLAGNIISRKNAKNQITLYSFDLFNRIMSVTTPSNQITSYEYLQGGELSKITSPEGFETIYEYNNMSRLSKKISPRGQVTQLSYDVSGNITQEIDPNGQIKNYIFNNLDQLTQKVLPDNTYNFSYNESGNLTSVSDSHSSFTYNYSTIHGKEYVSNILQSHDELPANQLDYSFDSAGKKIGMSSDFINLSYLYNFSGNIQTVTNSKNESFGFAYDFSNKITSMSRPNSVSTQYIYDSNSFLTQINHKKAGNNISYFHYSRDQINNRSQLLTAHGSHQYQYDTESQLVSASHPEGDALNTLENFSYDSLGNRITDNQGSYSYDNKKHRLEEDWKYIYAYDLNGNLISRQEKQFAGKVQNFTYSSENQLLTIEWFYNNNSEKKVEYSYDALGRRVLKRLRDGSSSIILERKYVYDGQEIIAELDEDNNVLIRYTHSGQRTDDVLSMDVTSAGVTKGIAHVAGSYFFHKDALGSIVDITNSSGIIIQHYAYSSFGKILKIENSGVENTQHPLIKTNFAYTNREFDSESGLYYYRARYYDAHSGRFLQEDPDPGKLVNPITFSSKYIYGNNNPVMYSDPTGRFGFLAALAWTAVYTAAISAVQASLQEGNWSDNFFKNWIVNFTISAVGLGVHGAMTGFNAAYSLGWGGIYSGTATGSAGFSLGFFQSTPGSFSSAGQLYWHEVGHAINFAIFSGFQGGKSLEDRFAYSAAFYGLHLIGSYGGQYNPATGVTEGGADLWSSPWYGFGESSGYVGFGGGVSPFAGW